MGDEVSLNAALQAQTTPLHFFFMRHIAGVWS
jgi:hypothetical protein